MLFSSTIQNSTGEEHHTIRALHQPDQRRKNVFTLSWGLNKTIVSMLALLTLAANQANCKKFEFDMHCAGATTPTVFTSLNGMSYPEQPITSGGINKVSMAGGA